MLGVYSTVNIDICLLLYFLDWRWRWRVSMCCTGVFSGCTRYNNIDDSQISQCKIILVYPSLSSKGWSLLDKEKWKSQAKTLSLFVMRTMAAAHCLSDCCWFKDIRFWCWCLTAHQFKSLISAVRLFYLWMDMHYNILSRQADYCWSLLWQHSKEGKVSLITVFFFSLKVRDEGPAEVRSKHIKVWSNWIW